MASDAVATAFETTTPSVKHLQVDSVLIVTDAPFKGGSSDYTCHGTGEWTERRPGVLRMARIWWLICGRAGREPRLPTCKPRLSVFRKDTDPFKSNGVAWISYALVTTKVPFLISQTPTYIQANLFSTGPSSCAGLCGFFGKSWSLDLLELQWWLNS